LAQARREQIPDRAAQTSHEAPAPL
jgi:hypothetical protein